MKTSGGRGSLQEEPSTLTPQPTDLQRWQRGLTVVAIVIIADAVVSVVVGVDAEEARIIVTTKGTLEGVTSGLPVGVEHLPGWHDLEEHPSCQAHLRSAVWSLLQPSPFLPGRHGPFLTNYLRAHPGLVSTRHTSGRRTTAVVVRADRGWRESDLSQRREKVDLTLECHALLSSIEARRLATLFLSAQKVSRSEQRSSRALDRGAAPTPLRECRNKTTLQS